LYSASKDTIKSDLDSVSMDGVLSIWKRKLTLSEEEKIPFQPQVSTSSQIDYIQTADNSFKLRMLRRNLFWYETRQIEDEPLGRFLAPKDVVLTVYRHFSNKNHLYLR
jgi:hypothetical protein